MLKSIDLSYNQIVSPPKQIGWLDKSLRKLILSFNQIVTLPGDFTFLNPALRLELEQNPLDPVINMVTAKSMRVFVSGGFVTLVSARQMMWLHYNCIQSCKSDL